MVYTYVGFLIPVFKQSKYMFRQNICSDIEYLFRYITDSDKIYFQFNSNNQNVKLAIPKKSPSLTF